jgi:hypothetical protein
VKNTNIGVNKPNRVTNSFYLPCMIFNNRRNFTRQKFQLKRTSLGISRKNLFDEVEYEISLEQISNKKKVEILTGNLFFIGIFLFAFGLCFVFGGIIEAAAILTLIAAVLVVAALINKKKVVTITTYEGDDIVLYFNSKNKQEVIEFSKRIIESSNNFLLNKYNKIDRDLPLEPQFNNIEFLRNREIITEEQYETLKNQLLGRENKSLIGFGAGN